MTDTCDIAHRSGSRRLDITPTEVTIIDRHGERHRYNRFWLRDNCPSNGDRASLARPGSVADLPDDLSIVDARLVADRLVVEFSDGVRDEFPADLLGAAAVGTDDRRIDWLPWRTGHEPDRFEIDALVVGTAMHHALLEAIARDGVALVGGLGADRTGELANLIGPIRETDFGRIFDIVTEPDPFTPSQSDAALDPHTDDPYRYAPPGISILQCVSPCDGEGGDTVVVDGLAVAVAVARDDPEAFRLLTSVPVPYVHRRGRTVEQGSDVHLRAEAPVVALDASGAVCGIRFHERSMAPLRLPPDEVEPYYVALRRFARSVLGGEFEYRRKLAAGEAVVYDNQRVLHGRTAIANERGRRHLRLCTIDRDQAHSRLRRLRETHRPGTEALPLPAGNLA